MLTLLNMTTEGNNNELSCFLTLDFFFEKNAEFDQILDNEHAKLLNNEQVPSEVHFIWSNV